ncbi:Lecithin:cholesterol acyltransferase-domain-containing protein [Dunaliella salina]|uniref:Lecithin:cholesterol acyltransferase-domain-containing protein n=1 Tax=Dunaliella salina TaxID=3046 RepID=A0ABQ7G0Z6_DUNSA|nr:Lecithin:cholesterol acyltransferase-domain-containing protein [Dunaliella salina]|eukprot:KAF5828275.1 Lecithin:cholesterol acyltransferase-domain-containing protein [Dunaliella salina]
MPGLLLPLFAVASVHFFVPSTAENVFKLPLFFVPPLTGVQLQQKLDKPRPSPNFWCRTHSDWSTLWIDPSILVPGEFSCAVENLKVIYSPRTNLSHSVDGVTVRPTHGFEILNPLAPLVFELERLGWQWGRQIQAYIYDWRLSPNDWANARDYGWAELKQSIEELRELNGGRRVILAGISMGSTYINAFLNSMVTEEWKALHIAGFFSISGKMRQT